jgi:hypothetical protein
VESKNTVGYMGKRGSGKPHLGLPLPKFGHQFPRSQIPAPIFLMILESFCDPSHPAGHQQPQP